MLRTIELNAGSMAVYDSAASDSPKSETLLLLHGFPLDHTMWRHQIDGLSSTVRVIAPDLRGFGRSTLPVTEITTMQDFASDISELVSKLELEAFVLGGLSMGGYIAWQCLQPLADRIRGLILCDTRASADSDEVARARQWMAQQVLIDGAPDSLRAMQRKLFAEMTIETQPDVVATMAKVMSSTRPESIAAAQRGMASRPDVTSLLSKIELDTLVICGEFDSITTTDEMREMSQAIPNARFAQISNAGHMAPLENPDETNDAIRAFLTA